MLEEPEEESNKCSKEILDIEISLSEKEEG